MKMILLIVALISPLSMTTTQAKDTNSDPRIERAILRAFPIEVVWANALLKLNLSDKKVIRLCEVFKTFWQHRQQMIEGATTDDRVLVRERTDALKRKLQEELAKHLEPGQILAIIPQRHTSQNLSPPRQEPAR